MLPGVMEGASAERIKMAEWRWELAGLKAGRKIGEGSM
jgi:hypothetical protein